MRKAFLKFLIVTLQISAVIVESLYIYSLKIAINLCVKIFCASIALIFFYLGTQWNTHVWSPFAILEESLCQLKQPSFLHKFLASTTGQDSGYPAHWLYSFQNFYAKFLFHLKYTKFWLILMFICLHRSSNFGISNKLSTSFKLEFIWNYDEEFLSYIAVMRLCLIFGYYHSFIKNLLRALVFITYWQLHKNYMIYTQLDIRSKVAVIYLPKQIIKRENFINFFKILINRLTSK